MILMNDFTKEPRDLKARISMSIKRVVESGWYVLGEELERFESSWSEICNVKFGVGVGNGMDAIEIILRTLGITHGDEVITTPMTAFATITAIIRAGAKPILADIDPGTGLLSVDSVVKCINKKTKAIILVHLYGQIKHMDQWQKLCKTYSIKLIEDCAQSHYAFYKGKSAGSFGDAGAFSFYPTKNLGAIGDAGMIVTNNSKIARSSLVLRNYGQSKRYVHPKIGLNSRLDEIQAAILLEKLKWLPTFTKKRQEIAKKYFNSFNNPKITLLSPPDDETSHVYHLFVIKTNFRKRLISHLKNNEIQAFIHYPIPIHKQAPCIDLKRSKEGLSCSEEHAKHCLSIPCHPHMSDDEVGKVINVINNFE